MSHDNRVYLNTTLNNVVVIDSEQNQIAVTHPITQVIEITQSPTPTVMVVEETPNNVSVTEAIGNTVIVSATGPQGVKGDPGSELDLAALKLFTGSIQSEVDSLTSATSSYVLNSQTSSMTVRSALTASRLEGIFSLTANSSANNKTVSSLGGLAFNNNAAIDQDTQRSLIFRTTPDGNVGSLATRLIISGSGQVGINTTTLVPSASLTVSGGVILNGTSSYFTSYDANPVQLHSGKTGNAIGIYSDVVNQYAFTGASPYYQFGWGGGLSWRISTTANQSLSIQRNNPLPYADLLYISSSCIVGIGTTSPLSNLHVYKGASSAPLLGLQDGITLTLENDTTNYINFRTPDSVYAGLAFTTPTDNSAGYIALRQSTGDMVFSNEKSTGYHTFLTDDSERLRIANSETIVRNNLQVSQSVYVSQSLYMNGNKQFNYGAFSSTQTQTLAAGVSGSMTFNIIDVVDGVTVANNSRLVVPNAGIYNIQFSAQLDYYLGADDVYIWLKKNGTNVGNSATVLSLSNNHKAVAAWNWVYPLVTGDYVEIAWQTSSGNSRILANISPGTNIPAIPSVIVTVTQVA